MQKALSGFAVKTLPMLLTLLMPIVLAALTHVLFISQIMPLLVVVCIYYWCMFLPGSLPYSFLFLLGIMQDTLFGSPLGFSSFVDMVSAWIVLHRFQMAATVSFTTIWLRFISVCFIAVGLEWCIMSLYYDRIFPAELSALRFLSTCLAYPLLHIFFARITAAMDKYS